MSGIPDTMGGTLQLAVEGAQRWWRDMGKKEFTDMFGEEAAKHGLIENAAVMGFLCGRLEIDKSFAWEKVQAAIREGKAQGKIIVPGRDVTERVV